jgi:hypothetical protein
VDYDSDQELQDDSLDNGSDENPFSDLTDLELDAWEQRQQNGLARELVRDIVFYFLWAADRSRGLVESTAAADDHRIVVPRLLTSVESHERAREPGGE